MGNQLVGIAPSQIFPVEHYLTDYSELKFDASLGSTRFLKVARADSQEGLVVVKVFAIHDPSLPLSPYKDRLDEIRIKLSSAVNCLPFQKIVVNEKAGLIMREYVKFSLYDRVSTRPFLTNIEKRWITFQVLYALHQCHKVGVCHGDIKLENIMVTSWNWVLLTDFASFKPTFLPEDNPADYTYFFDTSRRRNCYIAPERFNKSVSSESNLLFNETPCNSGDLKPAMDIFSAGCALVELWNEGHAPFELSQLLAYRSGEYTPQKHLDMLEDSALRNLLGSMISKDPSQRLSAELYLSQERGKLFPEYFYSFLQSYMLIFSTSPILSPDEKISRLKNDIGNVFKLLCPNNKAIDLESDKTDVQKEDLVENKDNDGLVIITALVTSCIRGLHDCTSKLQSLEILLELASHANEETILDRILPYIIFLAHDSNARVKVSAINIITLCLHLVKKVPRSDANIFPEYILPGLAHLAIDPNTSVRVAYAKNIATLAEIALRYLEYTQADFYDPTNNNKDVPRINYEVELQTLHEMVQQTVSSLLTDPQTLVKQTLMDSGITKLCVFFGRLKANDVLLSHIITFLNDKEDKELRGTFFDCIVGVAAFIGWHCSSILTPLLIQGLSDISEFVTMKCINAMSSLTELGLLNKQSLCELIAECSPFLVHPNLWIRMAVVGFIATTGKTLSTIDVQCKIMPNISSYMKFPLMQIEKPELLLDSLYFPIPRNVYDSVIKFSDIQAVIDALAARKRAREALLTGKLPTGQDRFEVQSQLKNLFTRLVANGMDETCEEFLLAMRNHLKKLHKYKQIEYSTKQNDGRIEISSFNTTVRGHMVNLSDGIIGGDMSSRHSESTISGSITKGNSSRPSSPSLEQHSALEMGLISMHERSYIQYRRSNCYRELNNLIQRQQTHYLEALRSKEWAEQAAWQSPIPPPGWRLKGGLVAHLHEHRSPVTRLCALPDTPLFASASMDGYVRIWDCSKMEGKNIANRSKQHYKMEDNMGIIGMAVCENGQSLAAATQNGTITVLRIDRNTSKMNPVQIRKLEPEDGGCAVDVQYLDSGPQSVIVYATLYGSLVGWDLRSPTPAWKLKNNVREGFITSFCIDAHKSWMTLGTSSGKLIIWDLRFQIPISTIEHPAKVRVRKVVSHPTEHSCVIASIQGNNEISMWNIETGFREKVLWGSSAPPLSRTLVSQHSTCAMYAGCSDRSGFLLTGGSDQRLRFWDLENPCDSFMSITAPNDTALASNYIYKSRLIDGTSVIYEVVDTSNTRSMGRSDEIPRAGPEAPSPAHRDCISDITLCKASQCFMLTASRDGVIKVWK